MIIPEAYTYHITIKTKDENRDMKRKHIFLIAAFLIIAIVSAVACCENTKNDEPEIAAGSNRPSDPEGKPEDQNPNKYDNLEYTVIPTGTPEQIREYEGFTVSFNKDNHTPNWVGWELLASETEGSESRSDNFWQDATLEGCPVTYDYSRSGYDRGHMCPAADQKWSAKAMNDCFVMANMCPQDHSLNSGAWATLEKKERVWAKRDGALIIVAGPVYEKSDTKRIGDTGVKVPSAFFKIIAALNIDEPRGIAFVYPNMSSPGNMSTYAMTIDKVETLTGFDFLSALPDDIENKIESTTSFKEWDR